MQPYLKFLTKISTKSSISIGYSSVYLSFQNTKQSSINDKLGLQKRRNGKIHISKSRSDNKSSQQINITVTDLDVTPENQNKFKLIPDPVGRRSESDKAIIHKHQPDQRSVTS